CHPITATRLCHPVRMVTMSQKEFQRVKVIENAAGGRLSVREAARLLQLSQRQVQRLKRRYRPDSLDWVQHGNRGRCMPWAVSIPQKQLILSLARGKYQGFNDSHLAEKLRTEESLAVSRETVRRILRAAKLPSPQKRRPRQYRSRRLLASSQGPHRTRLAHWPGPSGQRTSPGPDRHFGTSQWGARPLLRRSQAALRPPCHRRRLRLSLLAAPLRSGPLPQLALPARGRRRPPRHSGRSRHPTPTLARPSRLRRRNRRTLASTRWHATRLSRRRSAAHSVAAAGRIFRPPPCSTHHGAETKTHDASHLQPLRPPRFSGRYLNDKGVTESRCS